MSRGEIRLGRKLFAAKRRGETRAILLGILMILCSMAMYFIFGFTTLPIYIKSIQKEESECLLLNAEVEGDENWSSDCGQRTLQYPCLQVFVNLTSLSKSIFLYHNEDTSEINPKCSYIPKCTKNSTEVHGLVYQIAINFRTQARFPCYHDRESDPKTVILVKAYTLRRFVIALFWPTLTLIGGIVIIGMVKLSQYFSVLYAQKMNLIYPKA